MNQDSNDMDLHQAIKLISTMNPHITLSDIAFLMDMPYEPEPSYETAYGLEEQ